MSGDQWEKDSKLEVVDINDAAIKIANVIIADQAGRIAALTARNKKLTEALIQIEMRCSYTEENHEFVNLVEQTDEIFKIAKKALAENKEAK